MRAFFSEQSAELFVMKGFFVFLLSLATTASSLALAQLTTTTTTSTRTLPRVKPVPTRRRQWKTNLHSSKKKKGQMMKTRLTKLLSDSMKRDVLLMNLVTALFISAYDSEARHCNALAQATANAMINTYNNDLHRSEVLIYAQCPPFV